MHEFIYQPENKSEEELKKEFVIRTAEFQRLMDIIGTDPDQMPAQHIIVQGQRGMGKTTLLLRVYYEARNRYRRSGPVSVLLTGQQYSIQNLNGLWERVMRSLPELEAEHYSPGKQMEDTGEPDDDCYKLLDAGLKKRQMRVLLLIDDFDTIINRLTRKEQQWLREILITSTNIQIIGSSAVAFESIHEYNAPFFEFFMLLQLKPLTAQETSTLVSKLAVKDRSDRMMKRIESRPGFFEPIRILSCGSPRIIVIYLTILADSDQENSLDSFKKLMDYLTPQYRHWMDSLPEKQLNIVHCLALNWDGMRVSELQEKIGMESKIISAQMNNLVKKEMVLAVPSPGKNKYYQLNDRLFNIWHLMRNASGRDHDRVGWLLRFLEYWYPDNGELKEPGRDYDKSSGKEGTGLINTVREMNSIRLLLLKENPEKATGKLETLMSFILEFEDAIMPLSELLAFAFGRGLKRYVMKLFQREEYRLKDRFKVLYYALVKILEGGQSAEFLKMGRELSGPVVDMVHYISRIST